MYTALKIVQDVSISMQANQKACFLRFILMRKVHAALEKKVVSEIVYLCKTLKENPSRGGSMKPVSWHRFWILLFFGDCLLKETERNKEDEHILTSKTFISPALYC